MRDYLMDETSSKHTKEMLAQSRRSSSFGLIPLRISYPSKGDVPIPIGLNAELVKSTTGYGFTRFVQHAGEIVDDLARGRRYTMRRRFGASTLRLSDQALLGQLRNDPDALEKFFGSIVRYASSDQLLSWLDEAPGPRAIASLSLAFCSNALKHRR